MNNKNRKNRNKTDLENIISFRNINEYRHLLISMLVQYLFLIALNKDIFKDKVENEDLKILESLFNIDLNYNDSSAEAEELKKDGILKKFIVEFKENIKSPDGKVKRLKDSYKLNKTLKKIIEKTNDYTSIKSKNQKKQQKKLSKTTNDYTSIKDDKTNILFYIPLNLIDSYKTTYEKIKTMLEKWTEIQVSKEHKRKNTTIKVSEIAELMCISAAILFSNKKTSCKYFRGVNLYRISKNYVIQNSLDNIIKSICKLNLTNTIYYACNNINIKQDSKNINLLIDFINNLAYSIMIYNSANDLSYIYKIVRESITGKYQNIINIDERILNSLSYIRV